MCFQETRRKPPASPIEKTLQQHISFITNDNNIRVYENNNLVNHRKNGTAIIIRDPNIKNVEHLFMDSTMANPWVHPTTLDASLGRVHGIKFEYKTDEYILINIYAPSEGNHDTKRSFFQYYSQYFEQLLEKRLIIMGDWNIIENPIHDALLLTPNFEIPSVATHVETIKYFIDFTIKHNLMDSFLLNNDYTDNDETCSMGTFTFKHRSNNYFARLDRAYINNNHDQIPLYKECPLTTLSDHYPIQYIFNYEEGIETSIRMGHEAIKLNYNHFNSPHTKSEIRRAMENKFNLAKTNKIYENPYCEQWGNFIKDVARITTNESMRKAKQRREREEEYINIVGPKSTATIEEKREAEENYREFIQSEIQKNPIYQRSVLMGSQEKMSTAFFNKLKHALKKNTVIEKLYKDETDPQKGTYNWNENKTEIKNELVNYWSHIVRKRDDIMDRSLIKEVVDATKSYMADNNLNFDEDDIDKLDSCISLKDIQDSINNMKLFKSPGSNGIPIEFYVIFTNKDDIKNDLLLKANLCK